VLYEWYSPDYSAKSIVPSFSMAKSFVSAMIGIAIDEGKIKNTSEPITNYIDFFDKEKFGKITIQHLLDMQSGIHYNESYINPFGDVAKYYYGTNIKKYLHHLKIKEAPGKNFEYVSLNTQLLGLILEKATGKSLTAYLQEKLWTPLGMEHDASWSIDSKKGQTEKAFCCINARARDFAKFGRLYLHKGNWNGQQLVSSKWVSESVTFHEPKNYFLYSNQWWHARNFFPASDTLTKQKPWLTYTATGKGKSTPMAYQPSGDFYAEGHLGQFIYVSPKHQMIVVRLGKKYGDLNWAGYIKKLASLN
jgi:CubicO group peptidase (beta-lactamase class C family)